MALFGISGQMYCTVCKKMIHLFSDFSNTHVHKNRESKTGPSDYFNRKWIQCSLTQKKSLEVFFYVYSNTTFVSLVLLLSGGVQFNQQL